jgi:UDP-N-acetylglucosamine--N-acetylmuramyl-(pentapeptide) pyrophosphoryl-undecaprenol N-acetylglucosamine transferase
MELGYAAADFALCRAGAMTCAELTAVGLPAAYVPLPHGNGEQRLNAEPIEEAGGGLIIDDAQLSADWIGSTLLPILLDGELVAAMGQAAAASGNRAADTELAAQVLRLGRAERPGRQHRQAARALGGRGAAGPARPPGPTGPAGSGGPTGWQGR